ncbi:YbfB/YjiJ family MFS transporter [Alkalihalobacillus oceani]|uniref:YbfB/YjiJ family MFS transporter n=1 Tax=Halalkalibacter oceani TaxID=1653776 RepID=UPI00203BB29D|nr:YbfB/YjiJ family MFS transporter [Halalkalibacter oceani]
MTKHPLLLLTGGIFALMVAMGIGRFAYTPLLPLMQQALFFTDADAGYLASSNYAGYLIGACLAGMLPLAKSKTFYVRTGLVVSIVTTLSMGLTTSYFLMLLLRLVSGVASAFIFVLASSIVLDKLAATGRTSWSGLFYSGVGLGIFFSTLFIPGLHHLFDWQGVWIGLAAVSALLALFIWLWLKDSPGPATKREQQISAMPAPPRKWLPWLIVSYGLEGLGYIVTGTFIVAIAANTPAFNGDATVVWTVVGLAAVPSCIIWSMLAKKTGYSKALMMAMVLQAVGIALPVFSLSQVSLLISASLFGATFIGITTLAATLGRQISPTNSNRVIGYLTAVYAGGQMIGPTLAGILSSYTGSYHSALIGAASAVFIGAFLLVGGIRYEQAAPNKERGHLHAIYKH